jgi:hypothetical protein
MHLFVPDFGSHLRNLYNDSSEDCHMTTSMRYSINFKWMYVSAPLLNIICAANLDTHSIHPAFQQAPLHFISFYRLIGFNPIEKQP